MAATTDVGKPRFKQALVAEPIDENGAKFIDVMDPDSGNVFRFFEVEYALACAMDGERDVPGIVKWAQEELGLTPSTNEVRTVIRTLGGLGYLDDGGAAADTTPARIAAEAARPVVEATRPVVEAVKPHTPEVAADNGLARGVVVGQAVKQDTTAGDAFELGGSGSTASSKPVETLPAAPDIGLGKSGASTTAPTAPVVAGEQFDLGPTGPGLASPASSGDSIPTTSDMSLDLSDNMKIQLDDVKEAVRASKVITAVEVPKDLLDMLAAAEKKPEVVEPVKPGVATVEVKPEAKTDKTEAKVEAKADAKTEKKPDAKVEAKADAKTEKKPDAKVDAKTDAKTEKKPDAKVDAKTEKKPDAKDAKKPIEEKKPVPPAPASGTSPVLIALLVLVLLGAGAFFVWKFVLSKPAEGDGKPVGTLPGSAGSAAATPDLGSAGSVVGGSGGSTGGTAGSGLEAGSAGSATAAAGSGASASEASKLALENPAPFEHKPPTTLVVEWLEANDKVVKTGDVVARFVGNAKVQAELAVLTKAVADLPAQIATAKAAYAAAEASGDADATAAAKTILDEKEFSLSKNKPKQITAKKAELARYFLFAKADGKLTAVAKLNDKVTTEQTIVSIARDPVLAATFKMKDPMPAVGSALALVHKTSGKTIDCTVAEAKDNAVKVNCPNDPLAAFKADDEVTLK